METFMPNIKITIAIPAYNSEKTIRESIESALAQVYPLKEILVINDGSTDRTAEIARSYPIRVLDNEKNIGIGLTLERLMREARGRYVIYLCSDDIFTHPLVVTDYIEIFDAQSDIGIIGRYYYQFMNGYKGAIMVCRDKNILTQACNPSGMAFRKMDIVGTNKIFIEMPSIVVQYLKKYRWTMLEYDTIAARIHPGGNTGNKKKYYTESPIKNWTDLVGKKFKFNQGFVQLRNRAPRLLLREIYLSIKINPKITLDPSFWFYALMALIVPGFISRPLANFYRHRITRQFLKNAIIRRPA
jgi:glycosyltransferase involved in cell wall biosynthesis